MSETSNLAGIAMAFYRWLAGLNWGTNDNLPLQARWLEETPEQLLSWANVGIGALLLGFNVFLSAWLGLGLSKDIVVSAVRCTVQLTVLGMVLNQIFMTQNPVYIFGMVFVLGMLSAVEVTFWRSKKRFPYMFIGTLVSILSSALIIGLFGNGYSLNMDPAYTAVKFIPTIGMLFGSCVIGVSIGLNSVMESLDVHRDRVETMLCFGASRWEVIKPVAIKALKGAMMPTITNMSITGLINIPGMMTGWVLGGANVLQASRYQQIILFMISASTASSTLLSVMFCSAVLVDSSPRLRLDILKTSNGKAASNERLVFLWFTSKEFFQNYESITAASRSKDFSAIAHAFIKHLRWGFNKVCLKEE
ncbi:hypothetical protein LPJ64_005915 [Coemansia asiatica]|uniref:Uncharacterized protein n=1 Tax=Coemansia asiatica TaxID=1052880 RepID=A0A9W8CGI2_9FUNG|nr:hypothetical protein LPJ64_005915 [Coemansia asiatica]